MAFTEELLSKMVLNICGSYKIKLHPEPKAGEEPKELEIDFTPPFARIPMIAGYVYYIYMYVLCEYNLSNLSKYSMYVCIYIERESGTVDRLHPAIRAHPHDRRVCIFYMYVRM